MAKEITTPRAATVLHTPTDPVRITELPTPPAVRLRLLGTFGLTSGNGEVVPIDSPRAQSLLAYLVLHRDIPQPRRHIAFLLWPDSSEAQAHNNLRQLLHQLRRSWPEADRFVAARGGTLVLEAGSELVVDIDAYEEAVTGASTADDETDPAGVRAAFERAADMYRGELLAGAYTEWIVPERERLTSVHQRVLDRLIGLLEQQGDYRAAIERANERLRLDPLDERVVRWLMRLHALNQDRAGALRVYQASAITLERELGVEPDSATREAHDRVLGLEPGASGPLVPRREPGMTATIVGPPPEAIPLIGREPAWRHALEAWDRMIVGEARLVVISGEAGIGKSRLAAELCEWTARQGIGSARTRAYEAEGRLTFAPIADWLRSPLLAAALPRLDVGSLSEISRLLPELLAERPDVPRPSARIEDWQRQPFFQALARAFLAADQPLLLVLDDLQWCDADTLAWLHFLLRFDRRAKVLVAGTVRPDEVPRSHPLTRVVDGLRDAGQLTEIDLGPLDPSATSSLAAHIAGRALLPDQARQIHLETEGNPLFVVETMRAGLIDPDGSGRGGPSTAQASAGIPSEARRLPPKVQAIIAGRLAQLSKPARDVASLAATVGRAFPLEVLRMGGIGDEDRLVAGLDELVRRQIIREQGNGAYDFTHDKIREVAYEDTTKARRRVLHRRVAEALEHVHAPGLDVAAAQIAAQFANAGLIDRAAVYYQRAAEVAQRIGANLEAIGLLQRGLDLLLALTPSLNRDGRELGLQTALGVSLVATEGYGASRVRSVYARARQLCQILGEPPSPPILRALALVSLAEPRIEECHALGDHLMSLAERADDPILRVEAHFVLGVSLLLTGAAVPARVQLEGSLAHYDRARSATHISLYGQDPAVICLIRLSLDLWLLGEPHLSARRRAESLALAEELAHPFTHAYALVWDAILQSHCGNADLARTQAQAAIGLGRDLKMPFWLSIGMIVHGWAIAGLGDVEAGIDEIRRGMADFAATGSGMMRPFQLGLLAEQYGRLGHVERGLTLIAEALALVDRTNERWCEPELYRRKGELLEKSSADGDAEAAYRHAIDVARYQSTRALELRSATRLANLWRRQARPAEVAVLLGPIIDGFGSTTDLPELADARTLLTWAGAGPSGSDDVTLA